MRKPIILLAALILQSSVVILHPRRSSKDIVTDYEFNQKTISDMGTFGGMLFTGNARTYILQGF